MPDASTKEAFRLAKRRCKRILLATFALMAVLVLAALVSQAGIAFVWATEELLAHIGISIIVGGLILMTVFAPRCPHCGRRVPQIGMEGESNIGPDAEACANCLRSLPK